jgi:hypothetical protein
MDYAYGLAIAVLAFLGGIAGGYFRGYVGEKGKNRAAREDLGKLTQIVEDIKDTNARGLAELTESMRAHHSMRSAALEKRLEVHQDAYRMASLMFQHLYARDEGHRGFANDIRDWWISNALYLDDGPRKAFEAAWVAYMRYPVLAAHNPTDDPDELVRNFAIMQALPPALERAVALPPIVLDPETQLGAVRPETDNRGG